MAVGHSDYSTPNVMKTYSVCILLNAKTGDEAKKLVEAKVKGYTVLDAREWGKKKTPIWKMFFFGK